MTVYDNCVTIAKLGMTKANSSTETRQFAAEQTSRLLRHLAFQMSHTVKSCTPDSVHDVRVAIRRFTQAIAVFRPCLPGKDMRKIRRRLKDVMKAAGQVRDCDVALKLLSKSRLPDGAPIQSKVRNRRKEAARVLVGELRSWTERQTSIKWRAALESALAKGDDDFGRPPIEATARKTLRRMTKDFLERGNEAAGSKASAQDLHRFRIAAKKFRYSLELFAPLYGASLERGLAHMKTAQTMLGSVNDCEAVASLVAQLGASANLVARLKKRQRRKTDEFREYWAAEFHASEQLRSWMDLLRLRPMRKPVARAGTVSPKKMPAAKLPARPPAEAASGGA